jgi:hypothetical protein
MRLIVIASSSIVGFLIFGVFQHQYWLLSFFSLLQVLLLVPPSRYNPLGIFTPTSLFLLSFYLFHLPLGLACHSNSYQYICSKTANIGTALGMSFVSIQVYLFTSFGLLLILPRVAALRVPEFYISKKKVLFVVGYIFPFAIVSLLLCYVIGLYSSGALGIQYADIYNSDLNIFLRLYYSYSWTIPVMCVFIFAIYPARSLLLATIAIVALLLLTSERSGPAFIFLFLSASAFSTLKNPPIYKAIMASLFLLPISFIVEVGRMYSSNFLLGFLASGRTVDLIQPIINMSTSIDTVAYSIQIFKETPIISYGYHLISILPSPVWSLFIDPSDFPNLPIILAESLRLPSGTGKGFSVLAESFVAFGDLYWLAFVFLGVLSWYYMSVCNCLIRRKPYASRLELVLSDPVLTAIFFTFLSLVRDSRSTVEISIKICLFSYLFSTIIFSTFARNRSSCHSSLLGSIS